MIVNVRKVKDLSDLDPYFRKFKMKSSCDDDDTIFVINGNAET